MRTPEQDLEEDLQDPLYRMTYGKSVAVTDVGLQIALARHARDVSQSELALRSGYSLPYVRQVEHGDLDISVGTAGKLLAMLGLRLRVTTEPLLPSEREGYHENR